MGHRKPPWCVHIVVSMLGQITVAVLTIVNQNYLVYLRVSVLLMAYVYIIFRYGQLYCVSSIPCRDEISFVVYHKTFKFPVREYSEGNNGIKGFLKKKSFRYRYISSWFIFSG